MDACMMPVTGSGPLNGTAVASGGNIADGMVEPA